MFHDFASKIMLWPQSCDPPFRWVDSQRYFTNVLAVAGVQNVWRDVAWFLELCHEHPDWFLLIKRGWIYNFGKDSRNNEKSSKLDVFYRWNTCGLFCRGCESRNVRISRVPAMVSNYSIIISEIEHLFSTMKWMRFPHVFMCFSACGTMQINGNKSTWC